MSDLLGDEPFGIVELGEVGDVGMAQRMQVELRRQAGGVAGLLEGQVDAAHRHAANPLGDPQR